MASAFPVPNSESLIGLLDILPLESVDGVIIATPPTAHLGDLRLAVEMNLPALVEKPIVTDSEGLEMLRSLSERQRSLIVPAHLSRHMDSVRFMRRMIDGESLVMISAWRYIPRERLGLHGADHPALSAMIHDFDLVRSITRASVSSLHVTAARSSTSLAHPDTVVATMLLDDGALVTVGNSWTLPNSSRYVEATFEAVTRERKWVLTTPSNGLVVRDNDGDFYPASELGIVDEGSWGGAFERQLDYFAGVISRTGASEVTVEDAMWSIQLALDVASWPVTN
jgi:predicted dehydrogenase